MKLLREFSQSSLIADTLDRRMSREPRKDSALPSDKRRTQRILLRISILVRAQFEDGLPITEDTTTLEVNAHGG